MAYLSNYFDLYLGSTVLAPTTGTTLTLNPGSYSNYTVIIKPTGSLSTLTVALPATAQDGSVINISFDQPVSQLTWVNAADGLPAQVRPGYQAVLTYSAPANRWYGQTLAAGVALVPQVTSGFVKQFRAKVAATLAGTSNSNIKVLIIGDENTAGFGADTAGSYTGAFAKSMPNLLSSTKLPLRLPQNHYAGVQVVTVPSATDMNPYTLYDPRIVGAGAARTWQAQQLGGDGLTFGGTDVGSITVTPADQFDRIEIGITTNPGNSVGNVTVDGTQVGTLNGNQALGFATVPISLGSLASSFVINYPGTGSGLPISWIRTWRSTQSSIHIMQSGWNASTIATWNNNAQIFRVQGAMTALAADLVIVNGLILNDAIASTTAAAWASSFATLRDTIRAAGGEIACITGINFQNLSAAQWTNAKTLDAQMRTLCTQWDIPMMEMEYEWLPISRYTANYSDTRNPSGTGYAIQAQLVSRFIEELAGV